MYQALYRKYRPSTLEDVVGQDVVVKILTNSIKNNKISHAYLFCGPRGTGKTSIAKIMAKLVNCSNLKGITTCEKCESCIHFNEKNNTDIIEIDAASNNGVDEIRELKNKINLVPTLGKYKVYIIDEVHMLTIGAFNALLKTLEEPPSHAIFILATTEPHKIPITILSRCQRLDFKKISIESIEKRLENICEKEKINIEKEAITQIAKLCDGGMRDSISMLDKLVAYSNNNIKLEDVNEINGLINEEQMKNLITIIKNKQYKQMFETLDDFNIKGRNFTKLLEEIIIYLRNNLVEIINGEKKEYMLSQEEIIKYIQKFSDMINDLKLSPTPKIVLETNLIQMMSFEEEKQVNLDEKMVLKMDSKKNVNVETYEQQKIEKTELDSEIITEISKLKLIRVNNTLNTFDKKYMLEIKQKLENINALLIDPDYSELAGLLLDGILKASGKENLIFVYESDNVSMNFNIKIPDIEKMLKKIDVNMKVISVNSDEWEIIKKEFNSKTKKYIYEDDTSILEKIFKKTENIQNNSIESMFNDIIEYN